MVDLEDNFKLEKVVIETSPNVTKARLKEYISVPSKEFYLINSLIITLQKGLKL
jgi:hypothetical protein